ncbi:MAG: hypothetical protein NTV79_00770 [Candidatus Aureabacteria bacterium]|nr:hypothetical protein [Candidatus Auribacterota bacterium]
MSGVFFVLSAVTRVAPTGIVLDLEIVVVIVLVFYRREILPHAPPKEHPVSYDGLEGVDFLKMVDPENT